MTPPVSVSPGANLTPSRRSALGWSLALALAWNAAFGLVPRWGIWACVGSAAVVMLALLGTAVRPGWAELLRPRPRFIGLGFLWAVVLGAASELGYPPLTRAWPALAIEAHRLYALFGKPTFAEAWVVLPAIATVEELLFRGLLLHLWSSEPRWRAGAAVTIVYALGHLESGSWALVGLAAGCGALWTALRIRTGSLWPSLLCHVLWDLLILNVAPLVSRG